jgi:hypothetical protein
MSDPERFMPDPKTEYQRVAALEEALRDHILDEHFKFVERGASPSSEVDDEGYGYLPEPQAATDLQQPRPSFEPIDWRTEATDVLGLDRDTPFLQLATAIRRCYDGWPSFVQESYDLSPEVVAGWLKIRRTFFRTGVLTEDNLPWYSSTITGQIERSGAKPGGALDLEARTWKAEEDGHLSSLGQYGQITDEIGDREYVLARASQLRTGSSIETSHITGLKVYTAIQEPNTTVSHNRDAVMFDPVGYRLLFRAGGQEAVHFVMFADGVKALIQYFPDDVVRTIDDIVTHLQKMPGEDGIPYFTARQGDPRQGDALAIARANLLSPVDWHNNIRRLLRRIGVFDEGNDLMSRLVTDEGKAALERIRLKYAEARKAKLNSKVPFVLGRDITREQFAEAREDYESLIREELAA